MKLIDMTIGYDENVEDNLVLPAGNASVLLSDLRTLNAGNQLVQFSASHAPGEKLSVFVLNMAKVSFLEFEEHDAA